MKTQSFIGKVIVALTLTSAAALYAPAANAGNLSFQRYPNAGITPANAWLSGARQPYQRYPNTGISSANAWLSGGSQPYQRYPNAGITSANCWNSGCNQPYNQYNNVLAH